MVANFVNGPIKSFLNLNSVPIDKLPIDRKKIIALLSFVDNKKISISSAQQIIFPKLLNSDLEVIEIIEKNNLFFDEKGNEIYIEVKSSRKSKTVFNITAPEWEAAKEQGDKYFIYLVENALNNKIKIAGRIKNPAKHAQQKKIEVNISAYEIRL